MFPVWGGSHHGLDHRYHHHPHTVPYSYPHELHANVRPEKNLGLMEVHTTKDKFVAMLDIRNFEFSPDEISVKTIDNFLVVECERLEKVDEYESTLGFRRRMLLPVNCKVDDLNCAIGIDGILRVTIPRAYLDKGVDEKVHPIGGGYLSGDWKRLPPQQEQILKEGRGCSVTKHHFVVTLELALFSPDEICVKTLDDFLIIEGDHMEKEDGEGFITRKFRRRYLLPVNADKEKVLCEISSEGVLKVTVPRVNPEGDGNGKVHPVIITGKSNNGTQ